MTETISVQTMLDAARVDGQRLDRLERTLERALGKPLGMQAMSDPMVIRRRMVESLREEGASEGMIQGLEQLYMGLVRRAAVRGLLPAPPEGPWTRAWQAVLDSAGAVPRGKATIRLLAGWATARGLEPSVLNIDDFRIWAQDMAVGEDSLNAAKQAIGRWAQGRSDSGIPSQHLLAERLRKKSLRGSVRSIPRRPER